MKKFKFWFNVLKALILICIYYESNHLYSYLYVLTLICISYLFCNIKFMLSIDAD